MNKREFFDELAPAWEREHRADAEEVRLRRVLEYIPLQTGERVLDAGCGTGRLIPHLRRGVGPTGRIVALDFSCGMLREARPRGAANNAVLLQGDARALPFADRAFDLVVGFAIFPHLAEPITALREFRRVLGLGRSFVIAHALGREEINALHARAGEPVRHDLLPRPLEMAALLQATGFRAIDVIDEPSHYVARAVAA